MSTINTLIFCQRRSSCQSDTGSSDTRHLKAQGFKSLLEILHSRPSVMSRSSKGVNRYKRSYPSLLHWFKKENRISISLYSTVPL